MGSGGGGSGQAARDEPEKGAERLAKGGEERSTDDRFSGEPWYRLRTNTAVECILREI
jgi:hypothetical protein